jgi:hypothetical protein
MACRLGTPTPSPEQTPAATNTPLPTITPLPEPSPTSPPTPTSSDSVITDVAQVTEVLFFESAAGMPAVEEREYATRFPKSTARYINYQLNLEYPPPERRIEFVIKAVWYDPDGEIFAEGSMDGYIESDWTYSAHASGQGWEEPGKWPVGEHTVELSVGGVLLASGSYEITGVPSVSGSLGDDP